MPGRSFVVAGNVLSRGLLALMLTLLVSLTGCGNSAADKLNEPMGYKTIEALRERLKDVAKYGDGGSSLGGIPESIDALMKSDPDKAKKLLDAFQTLNTTDDKETRKKVANEMLEML